MSTALVRANKKPLPWWKRTVLALAKRAIIGLEGYQGSTGSSFAGARISRLLMDWVMSNLSVDRELQADLYALRARSRDLCRNSPYAKRFLQLLRANVVGPQGIRLQARIRSEDGRPFTTVNTALEEGWAEWGRRCTVDGRLSWRDVQNVLASSLGQDGEFLIRLVRGFDNEYRFALQLIDPDLLDVTFNRPAANGVNEIRMGIEVDRWQRPVAYWLWTKHPSEAGPDRERKPVPAVDIIHGFVPLRVNQTRGLPWFHPVLVSHKMLDGYQEAELVAARMSAAKPGYYKVSLEAPTAQTQDEAQDDLPVEFSPGTITELPPGYEFQGWDPQHPVEAYKDFTSAILRAIGAGLGVSYHSLANDLTGVNYSSARVGELADRDEWRALQQWTIEHVCMPIYEEWLQMALLTDALDVASLDHRKYLRVAWRPRGWAWVDPRNELDASEKELALGLNSRTRQCADQGRDFEEVLEDLAEEQKLIAEHGLTIGQPAAKPEQKPGAEDEAVGDQRTLHFHNTVHVPPTEVRNEVTVEPAPVEVRPMPAPEVHIAAAPAPSVTVENHVPVPEVTLQLPPEKERTRTVEIDTPRGKVTGKIRDSA
jgi:lambda family phage portal protein